MNKPAGLAAADMSSNGGGQDPPEPDEPESSVLVIDLVDRDRLDLSVSGTLHDHQRDAIEHRLSRFLACGFAHVRIDFSAVTAIAPRVEQVFLDAAASLNGNGGVLEINNGHPDVIDGLTEAVSGLAEDDGKEASAHRIPITKGQGPITKS